MYRFIIAMAMSTLLLPLMVEADAGTLTIGYLEMEDDPRYQSGRMDERIPGQPWGRPFVGAEVAAEDARFPLMAIETTLEFKRVATETADDLQTALRDMAAEGIHLVLLDLPDELVERVSGWAEQNGQVLFNVTATGDALRQGSCHASVFHLSASDSIRMHALAQYLVDRGWREVLVMKGPREADNRHAETFRAAANRYGLSIVEARDFVLGSDPRQREANNLDLLTRGRNFDVIYIADDDGEFAQTVPYATRAPRPVVGSGGLTPVWWHWNWRRHGAPQLNTRFERLSERQMTQFDWSAWAGVKAITEAAVRTESTDAETIASYLTSKDFVLDGFQGYRLSFRSWNNQLRIPIFLASPNWVAARAPFEGFLHPREDLDSLGFAEQESQCRF